MKQRIHRSKRLTFLVIALCLCFMVVIACYAFTRTCYCGDFAYKRRLDGTIIITKYTGRDETLEIPNEIDGRSVTALGDYAFEGCKNLQSVSIGATVDIMGVNPFLACSNLESIELSPEQTHFAIMDGALVNTDTMKLISYPCGLKQETYVIPQRIRSIGQESFWYCAYLSEVTVPDGVMDIEPAAFIGCTRLETANIGRNVISIEDNAFAFCTAVRSINIPESVTTIGKEAFFCCSCLQTLSISDSVRFIGKEAFRGCRITLKGNKGSYVERYACEKGIPFLCDN